MPIVRSQRRAWSFSTPPQSWGRQRDTVADVSSAAAVLSIMAGAVHFTVMPEHFAEWWGFGLFMLLTGMGQVAAGVLLLRRPSRRLMLLMTGGTLGLFGLFLLAYTVGLPVGPNAGMPETWNGP